MCTPSCRLLSRTFKLASSAGAIAAVLALAGTAWTGEGQKNDEVFTLNRAVTIPGIPREPRSCHSTSAGSMQIRASITTTWPTEAINPSTSSTSGSSTVTHSIHAEDLSALVLLVSTTAQRRQRILASCAAQRHRVRAPKYVRATMTFPDPTGCSQSTTRELWVGDGDSRVWVLDPTTGADGADRQAHQIPIYQHRSPIITKEPMRSATIQLIIW